MEAAFPTCQMDLLYFYTTAHLLVRRFLIRRALTISYLHPCEPRWHSTRNIPQPCQLMQREMTLVEQRAPAAMSLAQRADGDNLVRWWLAVDATRMCVCGTCRPGASPLPDLGKHPD